jgi:hypothetical protein
MLPCFMVYSNQKQVTNMCNYLCSDMLRTNHRVAINVVVFPKALHGTTCSVPIVPNIDGAGEGGYKMTVNAMH